MFQMKFRCVEYDISEYCIREQVAVHLIFIHIDEIHKQIVEPHIALETHMHKHLCHQAECCNIEHEYKF